MGIFTTFFRKKRICYSTHVRKQSHGHVSYIGKGERKDFHSQGKFTDITIRCEGNPCSNSSIQGVSTNAIVVSSP